MKDEILEKLLKYLDETKDFVLDQSPEIFQQMLKYEKFSCIYSIWISAIFLIVIIGISLYLWLTPLQDKYDYKGFFRVFTPFTSIVFLIILLCSIDSYFKIKIAPKYFIIQKLIEKKK